MEPGFPESGPGGVHGPTGAGWTDGGPNSSGVGAGRGTTVNIGWNTRGCSTRPGDAEYLAAWREVLMPIGREFNPDLVIVAAGFDAAEGDPLGGCHVSPACYAHLTSQLMSLANGKIILALEGGYSLSATAVSAAACMEALLGLPAPPPPPSVPLAAAVPEAPKRRESLRSTPARRKSVAAEAPASGAGGEEPLANIPARLRARLERKSLSASDATNAKPDAKADAPTPKQVLPSTPGRTPGRGNGVGFDGVEKGARRAIDETRSVHMAYWRTLRLADTPAAAPTVAPAFASPVSRGVEELASAVASLSFDQIAPARPPLVGVDGAGNKSTPPAEALACAGREPIREAEMTEVR